MKKYFEDGNFTNNQYLNNYKMITPCFECLSIATRLCNKEHKFIFENNLPFDWKIMFYKPNYYLEINKNPLDNYLIVNINYTFVFNSDDIYYKTLEDFPLIS